MFTFACSLVPSSVWYSSIRASQIRPYRSVVHLWDYPRDRLWRRERFPPRSIAKSALPEHDHRRIDFGPKLWQS